MSKKLRVVCSVFCGESDRRNVPYLFPLGIVYCATAIYQQRSYQVSSFLFDSKSYYEDEQGYASMVAERLEKSQADVLCVSGMSNEYVRLKRILACVKATLPELTVILGGGIVSAEPRYVLAHIAADYGIVGEGEESLPRLLKGIACGSVEEDIPGLVFTRSDGSIVVNEPQEIKDPDTIAFPDYSLFPEYEQAIRTSGVYPMLLSRSCPYRCTFCFHTCGGQYRTRSADNCLAEIAHAVKRYGIRHIFFFDEMFGGNMAELRPILERLHELHITYNAQTRADLVSDTMAQLLSRTGCTRLSVGIESVSDPILKSMNKRVTAEQIQNALETLLRHGIKTSGNIIIGDREETRQTAQTSIDWFTAYRTRYGLSIGMIQCYPGTELYRYAKSCQLLDEETYLERAQFPNDFVLNVSRMPEEEFEAVKRQVLGLSFLYRETPDIS